MKGGMKRVIVSVSNDLVADRRVDKVCTTLHDGGYDVLLVGCYKKGRPQVKRPYATHRFGLFFTKKFVFYAEFNIRLFFLLLFRRKDVLLCNDTDALPANYLASVLSGTPLVFDAHELFPEVPEVVCRPRVRRFWEKIEDIIFPHLKYSYTVCASIAAYYHKRYGIDMQVVRNIPVFRKPEALPDDRRVDTAGRHLLLYQGAVNKGRGVEWLIAAMPLLDDCVLYVCGDGDLLDDMKHLAVETGVTDRVVFTGRIPAAELDYYTAQAELGFVLLENIGLSYYYSLPNRIFDYMRYGVPVIASDFPEIAAVTGRYNTGVLTLDYSPEHLASLIRKVLAERNTPEEKERLAAIAAQFTWENEEKTVLSTVEKALKHK